MADTGTFLDFDFATNPKTGFARKAGVTAYGGAAKGKLALFTRPDGYLDPSIHPPGGLLGGSLEPGTHLSSLPNGAFQDGLIGWTQAFTGSGAVAIDPANSLSGTNALKLTTTATADSASATSLRVPLSGGVSFYLSVIAKTLSGSPLLSVTAAYFDATGAALSSGGTATPIAAYTPGATMVESAVIVTPPAAARFATFTPTSTGAVGVVEVDELRIDQTLMAKAGAAPAALRRAMGVYTVSLSDRCNLATTTDHTAALRACVADCVAAGGGVIIIPPGRDYFFSAAVQIPGASGIHLSIVGPGMGARMRRVKGYAGNILVYNGATQSNTRIKIEDLFFFSDYSADTAPTAAAISLSGGGALSIDIEDCLFWDQYGAIDLKDMSSFKIRGCRVFHSAGAVAAGFGGYSGLFFNGHCFDGYVSDYNALGQDPTKTTNLKYPILIQGADGIQFSNIYVWGYNGVVIAGGQGNNIDDIYFSNLVADNCNARCITITGVNSPYAYTNIRFDNVHADTHNGVSGITSVPIVMDGDADGVQFMGGNVGLGDGTGIFLSGQAKSWRGVAKNDIQLIGVRVYENNIGNTANTHGVLVDCPGVTIIGGSSKNLTSAGKQGYGVAITANGLNTTVMGVTLTGNVTGALYTDSGASSSLIDVGNRKS